MPQDLPDQHRILDLLQNFRGIQPVKELFWGELNYDRHDDPISRVTGTKATNSTSLTIRSYLQQAGETPVFTSSIPVLNQTACT